ncbi:MAG: LamG domain-containing protein, partial [Sedimentisphaerales bacterium]|nr:LamG domain-containing protein [Sedimentisphaerales bacterium]
ITGSSWIDDGRWHHVAATLTDDGSATNAEIRLYVDGMLQANALVNTTQHIFTSDDYNVEIGALINNGVATGPFKGMIDEVSIYTRALSDVEIFNLYSQLALTGDFTANGEIDLVDFGVLAGDWLYSGASDTDLTCDGMVDVEDLQIFSEQWLDSLPN